jgi:phage gpG-like protein
MLKVSFKNRNVGIVLKGTKALPEKVDAAAATGLRSGLFEVIRIAQFEYLMGPRPARLGEVTGRLRNSITQTVEQTPKGVVGTVGTNLSYGAFHEFGFNGVERVKAHTRTIGQLNGKGQEIDTRRTHQDRSGTIIFRESGKRAAGRQNSGVVFVQFVRAHDRHLNYKGRPFVRPAIEKGLPVIISEINRQVAAIDPTK